MHSICKSWPNHVTVSNLLCHTPSLVPRPLPQAGKDVFLVAWADWNVKCHVSSHVHESWIVHGIRTNCEQSASDSSNFMLHRETVTESSGDDVLGFQNPAWLEHQSTKCSCGNILDFQILVCTSSANTMI